MLSFLNTWENGGWVRTRDLPRVKYKRLCVIILLIHDMSFRNYPTPYCYQGVTLAHMIYIKIGYFSIKMPLHLSQKTWICIILVSRIEPLKNLNLDFFEWSICLNQLFLSNIHYLMAQISKIKRGQMRMDANWKALLILAVIIFFLNFL